MYKFAFFILVLLIGFSGIAQEKRKTIRKEKRAAKQTIKKEQIKKLVSSGTFIFKASNALPMGGQNIHLSSLYFLKLNNDSAFSYLPYYGVAYWVNYGSRNGGIQFEESIRKYTEKTLKSANHINFEIKTIQDNYKISLLITELGYATLKVSSFNRQSIQFFGKIEEIEKAE